MNPSACPATAFGRSECAQDLIDIMARIGREVGEDCEIVVSTAPPIVVGLYGVNGYRCPHGHDYWIEPTGEQIMRWNRDGTK